MTRDRVHPVDPSRSCSRAFEHQRYPFGDVLEDLKLERDLSRPPLVGTTFTLDRPLRDPGFAGIRATLRPLPFAFVPFDLTLNAIEDAGELLFYCVYNSDLLDERVARDFLDHYDRLLDALTGAPAEPISRLVALAPRCRGAHARRVESHGGRSRPRAQRARGDRTRAAPASRRHRRGRGLRSRHRWRDPRVRQLSARALSIESRQVALGLAAAGATPEAPVVLLAERDLEFWVTMLGILRAGATYLPIDPGLPRAADRAGARRKRRRLRHHASPAPAAARGDRGAARRTARR